MVHRDAIEWILFGVQIIGMLGTVIAVLFAVVAIRNGNAHTRAAQEGALRERRIDFQLGVLRDLGELNLSPDGSNKSIGQLTLLAAMLPIELVPVARVVAGLETTWEAGELRDHTADKLKENSHQNWDKYPVWGVLQQQIQTELLSAVEKLAHERE